LIIKEYFKPKKSRLLSPKGSFDSRENSILGQKKTTFKKISNPSQNRRGGLSSQKIPWVDSSVVFLGQKCNLIIKEYFKPKKIEAPLT
jgi:hypothetical protein